MPLFVVFCVALPALELWVLWQVAGLIGWPLALVAFVALPVVGYRMLRDRGVVALRRLRAALRQNRVPGAALVDDALDELAALAVAVPGFLTAACGLLLCIPPLRAATGRGVVWWTQRRAEAGRAPRRRTRERTTATVVAARSGPAGTESAGGDVAAGDDALLEAFVAAPAGPVDDVAALFTDDEATSAYESSLYDAFAAGESTPPFPGAPPVAPTDAPPVAPPEVPTDAPTDAPVGMTADMTPDGGDDAAAGADAWASFGTDRSWEDEPRRFRRRRRRGDGDESGTPT